MLMCDNKKNRIIIALSGGVDSAIAALMLKNQGFEVIGLTMRIWKQSDNGDALPDYIKDAAMVCKKLKIQHEVVDVREEFRSIVVDYFVDEYLEGRTPFPCAVCNPLVKWKVLYEKAKELNCLFIASGHYVMVKEKQGVKHISKGVDPDKDQSFFLWNLSKEVMENVKFPLGGMYKSEVKEIATENGLDFVKKKKESTGICFLSNPDYRQFLADEIEKREIVIEKGNFVDAEEEKIGEHIGYPYFTIGQRRGFGKHFNKAMYVCQVDKDKNQVQLQPRQALFRTGFDISDFRFYSQSIPEKRLLIVKIRYRKQAHLCQLINNGGGSLHVKLEEPLDMIAPGQTAVFYDGDIVVGGGFIIV